MKKVISMIVVVAVCLQLCACGKSEAIRKCENLIHAIGDVTVDSGDAIETAQMAYRSLTEKEKESIADSAIILEDARSAYIFELSKMAYQNVCSAYDITHKFGSDLYNAWYVATHESEYLQNRNTIQYLLAEVQYLDEADLQKGLAFVLAKNKYHENWYELSEDQQNDYIELAIAYNGDDFFNETNCLYITSWSIIRAYELNGQTAQAQEYLDRAKIYMLELSEKYSDYQHYPNLKNFFTMTSAYLDVCCDSGLSFSQYANTKNQYEKEARNYMNDLDFIFGK